MKTTIDFPEDLVMRAKTTAIARRTTLRSLVLRGLEREICDPSPEVENPLRALQQLDASIWKGTTADRYVENLRQDWA
jgi:hypothetical protein